MPKNHCVYQITDSTFLEESYEDGVRLGCRVSDRLRRWLMIAALVFYGTCTSLCCSIRYGFLADSFSQRNIPGKIYGSIEGSMFLGYAIVFTSGITELSMKRWGSRALLFAVTLAFSIASLITGLVFLIDHNLTVIVLSVILRVLHGMLAYASSLLAVDFINARLSTQFDYCNGLFSMGCYVGHGMAESIGCFLYDRFGYVIPFVFSSTFCFVSGFTILALIPAGKTYLAMQNKTDQETMKLVNPKNTLTKMLALPLLATMLINANYGVLQVTVTPYLHEMFGKSISYGGLVLAVVSMGMAIGSILSGALLQRKILHPFLQMALGGILVAVGLFLTFPPTSLRLLYNQSPILAFPGVFVAGVGDPMITVACLRSLYQLQLQQSGMLTPRSVTLITGIWLMGYSSFYFSGSTIAGVLTDYMSYSELALLLSGVCLISVLISLCLRFLVRNKVPDEEKVPLISGH